MLTNPSHIVPSVLLGGTFYLQHSSHRPLLSQARQRSIRQHMHQATVRRASHRVKSMGPRCRDYEGEDLQLLRIHLLTFKCFNSICIARRACKGKGLLYVSAKSLRYLCSTQRCCKGQRPASSAVGIPDSEATIDLLIGLTAARPPTSLLGRWVPPPRVYIRRISLT